ncbi:unnamed protein product [Ectocarpus sp. 12 AP-2014]
MNKFIIVALGAAVIQQLLSSLITDTPGAVSAGEAAGFAKSFARSCFLAQPFDQSEALLRWPAVSAGTARAARLRTLSCFFLSTVLDSKTTHTFGHVLTPLVVNVPPPVVAIGIGIDVVKQADHFVSSPPPRLIPFKQLGHTLPYAVYTKKINKLL